jgi:molybdate transport system substrate-binding protein
MKKIILIAVFSAIFVSNVIASSKPTLLFYCGITMVKPMVEISKVIEKKYNCKIKIIQGGSADLYKSLKLSKQGDLYLPGSESYRIKHLKEGILLDGQYIGFNKAAIFVRKGNPKHIKNLESLVDENIATILCNPKSGSIGKMTKKLLIKYKGEEFFNDAYDIASELGTDSRNLNKALMNKTADMSINWRATAFWKENSVFVDIVEIDKKYAPKKKLVLNLLKSSSHPKIAKALMDFASSSDGKAIMKRYGFR